MKKKTMDDFIDKADIGKTGGILVTVAGAVAGYLMKEAAEKTVKAFLIYKQVKID